MRACLLGALFALLPTLASATTISEFAIPSQGIPAFGDFGGTLATRSSLPDGTDQVRGSVLFDFDTENVFIDDDFFALTDLLPGASFSLSIELFFGDPLLIAVLDPAGGVLVPQFGVSDLQGTAPPTVVNGTVPVAGEIVVRVREGGFGQSGYIIDVTAARVPEPRVLGLLLGAAALGAARRRLDGRLPF